LVAVEVVKVLVQQHPFLELEFLRLLLEGAKELDQAMAVLVAQEAVIEEMLVVQVAQAPQVKEVMAALLEVLQALAAAVLAEQVQVQAVEMPMEAQEELV
jgi:hypothetical protein